MCAQWSQHDIKLQLLGCSTTRPLVFRHVRGQFLDGLEVDNEIVLDGEDSVGCEPGVVL